MAGDDAVRHCGSCKSNVYNLSAMNDAEVETLLARGEDVCIRYYYRPDGTIVTTKCADRSQRAPSAVTAGVVSTLAVASTLGGITAVLGDPAPQTAMVEGERVLVAMGGFRLAPSKPLTPEQRRLRDERRAMQRQLLDAKPVGATPASALSVTPSATPSVASVSTVSTPSREVGYGVFAVFAGLLAWIMRRRPGAGEPR